MMTVTDWIQALSTVVLVIITGFYVWRTWVISKSSEKQAIASVKMAEEMREQRYDAIRPRLDIQRHGGNSIRELIGKGLAGKPEELASELISEGFAATEGNYSRGLDCIFRNIGLGPAIDVTALIQLSSGECILHDFGTLGVGKKSLTEKLSLGSNQHSLKVNYKDSFGRSFESSREFIATSATPQGWRVGPLHTTLVQEVKK